jgi:hypothetical protein
MPPCGDARADVDVARRVVSRWRAFVAKRKRVLLLRLLQELPEVFAAEVLGRLDPIDRTMRALVGRPWVTEVLASVGFPALAEGSAGALML